MKLMNIMKMRDVRVKLMKFNNGKKVIRIL
jgi:hypothetical protein